MKLWKFLRTGAKIEIGIEEWTGEMKGRDKGIQGMLQVGGVYSMIVRIIMMIRIIWIRVIILSGNLLRYGKGYGFDRWNVLGI